MLHNRHTTRTTQVVRQLGRSLVPPTSESQAYFKMRADCSRPCPVEFSIPSRLEIAQPQLAICSSVSPSLWRIFLAATCDCWFLCICCFQALSQLHEVLTSAECQSSILSPVQASSLSPVSISTANPYILIILLYVPSEECRTARNNGFNRFPEVC